MQDSLFEESSSVKKVFECTPLNDWIKTVEDHYIIETISDINAKCVWECNEATYALQRACLGEWKSRYRSKPIPKIVSEIEMVLNDDRDFMNLM
tara:strand:+ start:1988 stop:2269 length:282 start_codon:yes stop_codon:yes gene_type:complete